MGNGLRRERQGELPRRGRRRPAGESGARCRCRSGTTRPRTPSIRHLGPTAQDFRAAFGLGDFPLRINTIDADGVALAGVKALEARTRAACRRERGAARSTDRTRATTQPEVGHASMCRVLVNIGVVVAIASAADAQSLGTFRWQLQPYCNVVTLSVTQVGGIYRLEGTDDRCGAAQAASAIGTAFLNQDGSIGIGLNIVAVPGGQTQPVSATLALATLNGGWRDEAGHVGTLAFTAGAGTGGSPRPLPSPPVIPTAIRLRSDGAFAAIADGDGEIPASGPGARMMWYANKRAFRAGGVSGSQWDDSTTGVFSTALGLSTIASGAASMAFGLSTRASGDSSTALGHYTTARALAATAMGESTTASGPRSTALGLNTQAGGSQSLAAGVSTAATGSNAAAFGDRSVASGNQSLAAGVLSQAAGAESVALGFQVTAGANGSVVLGSNATAQASAVGTFLFADRSQGMVPSRRRGRERIRRARVGRDLSLHQSEPGVRRDARAERQLMGVGLRRECQGKFPGGEWRGCAAEARADSRSGVELQVPGRGDPAHGPDRAGLPHRVRARRLSAADQHHRRRRRGARRGQGARSAHARLERRERRAARRPRGAAAGVAGRDRGIAQKLSHRNRENDSARPGPEPSHREGDPMSKSIAAAGVAVLIVLAFAATGSAQTGTITGVVTNASTAQPLAGVSVRWCTREQQRTGLRGGHDQCPGWLLAGRARRHPLWLHHECISSDQPDLRRNRVSKEFVLRAGRRVLYGTPTAVAAGQVLVREFRLAPPARVLGVIRDAATNAPLASGQSGAVWIRSRAKTRSTAEATTNVSGAYTIADLPAGSYYAMTSEFTGYVNEFFGDVWCPGRCNNSNALSGAPIVVPAGSDVAGRDFALRRGGSISGTITGLVAPGNAAPVAGASISAFALLGDGWAGSGGGFTDAAGHYTVTGLPDGLYYLQVAARRPTNGLLSQFYGGTPCGEGCSFKPADRRRSHCRRRRPADDGPGHRAGPRRVGGGNGDR